SRLGSFSHAWASAGVYTLSLHAALPIGSGRLDIFVRGTDNAPWLKSWEGGWSGFSKVVNGTITSEPAAVFWGDGLINVFARGEDGSLMNCAYPGSVWHDWESLGGNIIGS